MGVCIEKCIRAKGIKTVRDIDDMPEVPRVVLLNRLPMHAQEKYEGQHLTLFTMFETDMIPADYVENLHNFDQLIVPSRQNQEMFQKVFDGPVHCIPLGVDTDWWKPTERKEITESRPFTVLTAGNGMHRKGFDLACEAFKRADIPGARLIVKCNPADETWDLMRDYPDVIFLQEKIPGDAERELYESAHIYLGLSRGEGFGLQPLQAIHQGLPTIASLSSGHLEFKELYAQVGTKIVEANYGIWGYCGQWWEPDVDQAAELLRDMWTNYKHVKYEAWHQAKRLQEVSYWSWERVTNDILRILPRPFDLIEKWQKVKFHHRLFRVISTRDCLYQIGDESFGLEHGKEYWVTPDIKRMLYDQRALKKECLTSNQGLDAEKVASYLPLNDRCPTCQRILPD